MDTVSFGRPPLPLGFDDADISTVPADSPLVLAIDKEEAVNMIAQTAFKFNKKQHADQTRGIVEDLVKAGWRKLELEYAIAFIEQTSDEETLKEIRYSSVIGNLIFNTIRSKPPVQAGRLHSFQHAIRIANKRQRPITDIFSPVRVAGDASGEIKYLLKSF